MSLHTRCPQRIASTAARCNLWRRRCVRSYASSAASDPEWFQQVRSKLLRRFSFLHHEDLDKLHHNQLKSTLTAFVPRISIADLEASLPLASTLTRFNARVLDKHLLPDGTDPAHSPKGPWVRRMWAGGSVVLNPGRQLFLDNPLTLGSRAACLERIKDVRLQGEDEAAKIFVTIERRIASYDRLVSSAQCGATDFRALKTYFDQQARDGVEWGDALLKEERSLVFLRAHTDTQLRAIQNGETTVPRYLTCTYVDTHCRADADMYQRLQTPTSRTL